MTGNGNGRTWIIQLLAGILATIALAVGGYAVTKSDNLQAALAKEYVPKSDFQLFVDKMDRKLDKISDQISDLQRGDRK
jgi:hypothetical protein